MVNFVLFLLKYFLGFSYRISTYLEDKLSSVENEYREKQKLVQLDKNHGLEERLIAMQKKYEVEKKNELEEEVHV